jgi:low affinity Fe/Cu permease
MNERFIELTKQLKKWNGRRRLRDGLLWLPRGLSAGLMLGVVVATAARFRPLLTNEEVGLVAAGLGLVGLLLAAIILLLRRFDLLQQARFADRQFLLQERASTAVEIHATQIEAPAVLADLQLNDTLTAVQRVDTPQLLPFQMNKQDWVVILLAIVLLGTAVLLPNAQTPALLKSRAIQATIEEQVEALEALQEEIIQNPQLTDKQEEELLEPIQNALEGLDEGGLSQEEAVATLSEAEADLKTLAAENDQAALQQSLQDAGQPLADNQNSQSLGQSLQNGDLAQAGAAAAQLADSLPTLTDEELAQLAEDLMETAVSLQDVDAELAQELAAAAQALQNGDIAAAQQALQQASGTLQERAQANAAANQANAAANQLGEGRQDVAQAGQSGQAGQGEQAEGSGQGQGEGQGEGQGSGQGQGEGSGQGGGDGNGQGQGSGSGSEQGSGTGGPGPGGGHSENVFVPDLVDLSQFEGEDIELPAECIANPADCGGLLSETPTEFGDEQSIVPYEQVFGDYRNAANEALADDYIPLGLKGYIRDYFSSLEP